MEAAPLLDDNHSDARRKGNGSKDQTHHEAENDIDYHEADQADRRGYCTPRDVAALQPQELQGLLKTPVDRIFPNFLLGHDNPALWSCASRGGSTIAKEQRKSIGGCDEEDTCTYGHHDLLLQNLLI